MAHISSTFNDAYPGALEIKLDGEFFQGVTGRRTTIPGGTANVMVRAVVNGQSGPAVDRFAPTSVFIMDYPGGNASWTVTTETLAFTSGGTLDVYGMRDLILTLTLQRKSA